MITRAKLEDRLKVLTDGLEALKQQAEQLRLNMAATDGAIQDVKHWLAEEDGQPSSSEMNA